MADKIALIKELRDEFGYHERVRALYEPSWKDQVELAGPRYYDLSGTAVKGKKVGQSIFDGTPQSALRIWTNGFIGYMVNEAYRWHSLSLPIKKNFSKLNAMGKYSQADDIPRIRTWLQDWEEVLYTSFRRSNFYSSMRQFTGEGGLIGTSTMYVEKDKKLGKINYIPCHPGEIFISEDQYGKVDMVYRRFKMTVKQIEAKWGPEKMDISMKADLMSNNMTKEYGILHIVKRRKNRDTTKEDSINMPWVSYYIAKDSDTMFSESGYKVFPYIVWRVYKVTGELYGFCPTSECIVEIQKSHNLSKSLLEAAQMEVWKPWVAPEELRGKVNREPWGITYHNLITQNAHLGPIDTRINYPIGKDREDDSRNMIKEAFNVPFFQLLSAMDTKIQRTATEILEMQGERAVLLGSSVGSFREDALDPVFDILFQLLSDSGEGPEPPPELYEYQGEPIEIDYLGPLAQAQKKLFKTQGIQAGLAAAGPIITVFPNTKFVIDEIATMREVLEASGYPAKCIRSIDETNQMIEQTNKKLAAQEAAAEMTEAAKVLPAAGKAIEPNSPLAGLIASQGGA